MSETVKTADQEAWDRARVVTEELVEELEDLEAWDRARVMTEELVEDLEAVG